MFPARFPFPRRILPGAVLASLLVALLATSGCRRAVEAGTTASGLDPDCELVKQGFGPAGQVPVKADTVVSGLEVPWGIAFLPGGDLLVTERPGRLRLVRAGALVEAPVATLAVRHQGEGGLLGIALHPEFATNRLFYLYFTAEQDGTPVNRIERWRLAADGLSAQVDRRILDGIPGANVHNGGRLRFGPDGMLYATTGDSTEAPLSQDLDSLAGKLLRLTPDGDSPADNPRPGKPVFAWGIRNGQGFDWPAPSALYLVDHGPSGEQGRRGHDEVNHLASGDNLGWPTIFGCESREGMVSPSLVWTEAVPPGGAALYTGTAIPEWRGSLLVGTLGSRHLHRVAFDPTNPARVALHEVYFEGDPPGGFGRLRETIMGPDGHLYVTTSNCDGRGTCPPEKDRILRISR